MRRRVRRRAGEYPGGVLTCFNRCSNSSSVSHCRVPKLVGRSNGVLISAAVDHTPCRSGSPHGVRGAFQSAADIVSGTTLAAAIAAAKRRRRCRCMAVTWATGAALVPAVHGEDVNNVHSAAVYRAWTAMSGSSLAGACRDTWSRSAWPVVERPQSGSVISWRHLPGTPGGAIGRRTAWVATSIRPVPS